MYLTQYLGMWHNNSNMSLTKTQKFKIDVDTVVWFFPPRQGKKNMVLIFMKFRFSAWDFGNNYRESGWITDEVC